MSHIKWIHNRLWRAIKIIQNISTFLFQMEVLFYRLLDIILCNCWILKSLETGDLIKWKIKYFLIACSYDDDFILRMSMDNFENWAFGNVFSILWSQNPNVFLIVLQIENLLNMILDIFWIFIKWRHWLMKMLYNDLFFFESLLISKMLDKMKKRILLMSMNDSIFGFSKWFIKFSMLCTVIKHIIKKIIVMSVNFV